MRQKIAVLGPGSWGTALAQTLAENGHNVRIWGNVPEQIDEINTYHTNQHFYQTKDSRNDYRISRISRSSGRSEWYYLSYLRKQFVPLPKN